MATRMQATVPLTRRQLLRGMAFGAGGLIAGSFLTGCGEAEQADGQGGAPTPGGTLTVSVWGGVVEDALRDRAVPLFTERTGASVNFDTGPGGERLNKLLTQDQSTEIDVFINTVEFGLQALDADLIMPLNTGAVGNYNSVPDWGRAGDWGVAMGINALGLIFTPDSPPLSSWRDLWTPDLQEKVSLPAITHSNMPHFLVVVAELFGGSQDDIEPGLEALAELQPATTHFFWTDWAPLVQTGEVIAAVDFDLYANTMIRSDEFDVEYRIPEEKALPSIQMMGVVEPGNQELAHEFISAVLDVEVQQGISEDIYQTPSNADAVISDSVADLVIPTDEVPDRYRFLDEEFLAEQRREWTELLNESLGEAWQ